MTHSQTIAIKAAKARVEAWNIPLD